MGQRSGMTPEQRDSTARNGGWQLIGVSAKVGLRDRAWRFPAPARSLHDREAACGQGLSNAAARPAADNNRTKLTVDVEEHMGLSSRTETFKHNDGPVVLDRGRNAKRKVERLTAEPRRDDEPLWEDSE